MDSLSIEQRELLELAVEKLKGRELFPERNAIAKAYLENTKLVKLTTEDLARYRSRVYDYII